MTDTRRRYEASKRAQEVNSVSAAKETLEKIFYAAVGAGDSWVESASELLSDSEKRQKRIETLAKRGKKRLTTLEKNIEKRRDRIRKEIESRVSQERLEEFVAQARDAVEPLIERIPASARPASRNGSGSTKKTRATTKAQSTGEKAAS
jgi:nucleosome binding factor SPN SPT16 subunit